jgi:hypothetical protein
VPPTAPTGTYKIGVVRVRGQDPLNPVQTGLTPPGIASQIQIRVEPNVAGATPTPDTGYLPPSTAADAGPWLAQGALPYPKVLVSIGGTPRPAAAHLELTYPTSKLVIKDVYEQNHLGRHSLLTWSAANGRLKIDWASRESAASTPVYAIAVAFDLVDPWAPGGTAVPADFVLDLAQRRLYDANAALVASPLAQIGAIL